LRATIPNSDHHFWPGQFVNVRLVLSTEKGAVLIPNEATQISQKGPYVYVVKPDQTAELRLVTLGQRQDGNVAVTSGLAAGENVVLTGQLTIVPGFKVKVVKSAPATNNPSGKSAGDESSKQGGGRS
jgi:multidrug efflux system membrane fusion protein